MNASYRMMLVMAILVLAGTAAAQEVRVPNDVVAVVDKQVITRQEVLDRARADLEKLPAGLSQEEYRQQAAACMAGAFRGLLDAKLILIEADRLVARNQGLADRIEEVLKRHVEGERRKAGTETRFRADLQARGLVYEAYLARTRADIKRDFVLQEFVYGALTVSPAEELDFYNRSPDLFREAARARFRQIVVSAGKQGGREQARTLAERLAATLKQNGDFASLARQYSDGPRAQDGGLGDFVRKGALVPALDGPVFTAPVGEIAGPVELEDGFAIVKVEQREEARLKSFAECQKEIEERLLAGKRRERYEALIHRLEEASYIELRR